jgi:RNA polymerase sigma-70 factor (ECF subfamily)
VLVVKEDVVAPTGSRDGFDETLYREVAPGLWRAIYVYAGARGDIADDAVAEAFTRAMETTTSIREPKAWLYRVAFRAAAAELRERRQHADAPDEPLHRDADLEEIRPALDALNRLPPNQRAAMIMHYRLDLSVRQIADALEISPATVKVHLHRGRNRLRELLGRADDA